MANTILRLQGETRPLVGLGPMDKVRKTMDGIRGRYTVLNRTVSGVDHDGDRRRFVGEGGVLEWWA